MLEKNGYLPKKIIHIDVEPKSKLYYLLRSVIGTKLAKYILELYRRIRENLGVPNKSLANKMLKEFSLSTRDFKFNLNKHPTTQYERVSVFGLDDKKLIDKLENEYIKTFLFTGGGILKSNLLSIKDAKFFHIHPGIVPEVKGSDGFFWSLLLRNRPGYSVFYMNPGIDTGDVVHQKEFDFLCSEWLPLEGANTDLYHLILSYYDPTLRILTFIEMLENNFRNDNSLELNNLHFTRQNPDDGRTYFFMHEKLRRFVIDNMIREKYLSKL